MSRPQPASPGRQLPRGHLLVLNRSFHRTLEAENKSPRTIEAYTDAFRLLATFCQAHGQPLVVGKLRREHMSGVHRRPARPLARELAILTCNSRKSCRVDRQEQPQSAG